MIRTGASLLILATLIAAQPAAAARIKFEEMDGTYKGFCTYVQGLNTYNGKCFITINASPNGKKADIYLEGSLNSPGGPFTVGNLVHAGPSKRFSVAFPRFAGIGNLEGSMIGTFFLTSKAIKYELTNSVSPNITADGRASFRFFKRKKKVKFTYMFIQNGVPLWEITFEGVARIPRESTSKSRSLRRP